MSGTITIGHPNQGLKHSQTRKTRLGTWADSFSGAISTSKLGCPKPLQRRKPKCTLGPRPSSTVQPLRPAVEQTPPRSRAPRRDPSKGRQSPTRSRPPRPRPPWGLGTGENSASLDTTLGRLGRRPNHLTGRGALIRQPLHGMGRESDGVRRRQPVSATTPHSGRDRCLVVDAP